jgi:hypothetical protein
MTNREDTEMAIVFKSCYTKLNGKGQHLTLHVLDNKCSHIVKEYITSENTNLQIVEFSNNSVNVAKQGYTATQYHTIAILCTIDTTCPIQLWDQSMRKIETTLNIIQTT